MLRSIALLLLLLALPTFVLAGCGDDDEAAENIAEKVIESESGGDVDIEEVYPVVWQDPRCPPRIALRLPPSVGSFPRRPRARKRLRRKGLGRPGKPG